jgi:hypothetical protein
LCGQVFNQFQVRIGFEAFPAINGEALRTIAGKIWGRYFLSLGKLVGYGQRDLGEFKTARSEGIQSTGL